MLLELEVDNFALVDHLTLSFEPGLTVLTGETGAGKSIVLDSIGFLFGGAPREEGPPQGRPRRVAGRFAIDARVRKLLLDWEVECEQDEVLLARELKPSGRTSCRINSRLMTVANLRELGELMLDLHGQHQSHSLQRPSRHLELLDRVAGKKHLSQLAAYEQLYRQAQAAQAELDGLRGAERERVRELEWLTRDLEEIRDKAPVVDEEEELEQEFRRLSAAEELSEASGGVANALGKDNGCLDVLAVATRRLEALRGHDDRLGGFADRLGEAEIVLSELQRDLVSYRNQLVADPARLDAVQTRLEVLKGLRRKYGATLADVLDYAAQAEAKIEQLSEADRRCEALESRLNELWGEVAQAAGGLTTSRRRAAQALEAEVVHELAGLGMARTTFVVRFETLSEPGLCGAETAEFLMSPNPGQEPKPLARVASGGELSRVMLALVALFARYDAVPTLVFDEIDVGLGGRAAEAVAAKLKALANHSQVICVTHLAVVAATGHQHVRVHKDTTEQKTLITVDFLDPPERVLEVARMISGDASPETALRHAEELLRGAGAGMAMGAEN
ncbi:MAG: DNA repair protein RecN [Candidatus Eremiobacteraeota bacterium]|nr:DNA repair protein RecN [Candidatus Eremiobacteraeota bacterium]